MAGGGAEGPGAPLVIRLFGPFEVWRDGEPLPPVRTRKGLWLLALLTLHHNRPLDREWLAATLWPDSSEPQGLYNLRRALSDLRRALGTQSYRLQPSRTHSVFLDLTDAEADVVAFDEALASGDDAALEEAVGLYRGPLLVGCAEEWAVQEREAREQSCLGALEMLATRASAQSDPGAAARFLRQVVAVDPYRETAHRALMEALAASGDIAAAILVYRELRDHLQRELNTEPSPETSALFERLRVEARGRAPAARPMVDGSWLMVGGDDAAHRRSAMGSEHCPRGNLPEPLSGFVGREKELGEIDARLAGGRLVTLTGPGGIGKTRLAIRAAGDVLGGAGACLCPADGAWFVDLASLADPALVPQAVAQALRVRETPGHPLTETLQEALHARHLLLVLDNCEHLLDASAQFAHALLSSCPQLRILATSRQPLGISGEQTYRVPSLPVPDSGVGCRVSGAGGTGDPGDIAAPSLPDTPGDRPPVRASGAPRPTPDTLLQFSAIRLFVERAQAALTEFALTEQNAPAVVQVCRRLDGIPLAIELAAVRVRAMPLETIAARLDDRFHILTGGSRTDLPRQQTLRASIDWSYDLLSVPERTLLRRLSVFAGGWTLEAAEAICGDDERPPTNDQQQKPDEATGVRRSSFVIGRDDVLDLLTSLVEKSLVVYEEQPAGARYRLLETVRQYSSDRLREDGEGEAIRERHLEYFLGLAEAAEPHLRGAERGEWLEPLETEHDNLRAALGWSLREGTEAGLRLAGALWRFWSGRGHVAEGRERLAQVLAVTAGAGANAAMRAARAKALDGAGMLALLQAEYEAARSHFEESLAIKRELDDRPEIAHSLSYLAMVASEQGAYGTARSLYEESLAIRRELGDRLRISNSLGDLGTVAQAQADYGAARTLYEESLAIKREFGDRLGVSYSLNHLGNIAYVQGEYAKARTLYEEGLAIRRECGDRLAVAHSLDHLGKVAYGQGEYGAARSLHEESLAIRRELGSSLRIADSLSLLGMVASEQGEYGTARSLHEESLTIRRECGDRLAIADSLEALAVLACVEPGQSGAGAEEDEEGEGDEDAALVDSQPRLAPSPSLSSSVREREEARRRAARLFGASDALREAIGAPVRPHEPEAHRRAVSRAREMLDAAAFAAAWAEGRAMTAERAAAYALEEPPEA